MYSLQEFKLYIPPHVMAVICKQWGSHKDLNNLITWICILTALWWLIRSRKHV